MRTVVSLTYSTCINWCPVCCIWFRGCDSCVCQYGCMRQYWLAIYLFIEGGDLTAAFNLQETILHNTEQGNNVYVSFLDSSKAFDTVWREGLMFQLYNIGVIGKIWTLINNCHQHTTSSVRYNQNGLVLIKVSDKEVFCPLFCILFLLTTS